MSDSSAEQTRPKLPRYLAERARMTWVDDEIPVLFAHPDWESSVPVVIWLHGRTVNKELDPGRYMRWLRAGFAACAIDLPGHGERYDPELQLPQSTMHVIKQSVSEIDRVVAMLRKPDHESLFDTSRMGIGGMSAGGMIALRRLCDPHPFRAASIEAAAGDFAFMPSYQELHPPTMLAQLSPAEHLSSWEPIPIFFLHSEADEVVPIQAATTFIDKLRARYRAEKADPARIHVQTWPNTGAPQEHMGFGRCSSDAKNLQTAFFRDSLGRG